MLKFKYINLILLACFKIIFIFIFGIKNFLGVLIMTSYIEKISAVNTTGENYDIALIIRADFHEKGIHFFTPSDLSQQVAYMSHPAKKIIEPHVHNPVPRQVHYTQEVLIIRKGVLRCDFYDKNKNYIGSKNLYAGDVILLISGGHGFQVIEDIEMIEIKQGPYAGEQDKTRFTGITPDEIIYLNGDEN